MGKQMLDPDLRRGATRELITETLEIPVASLADVIRSKEATGREKDLLHLPTLRRLHAIARLGAELVQGGERVLVHCQMGLNRSALVAGLILVHTGMAGDAAVARLQERRPGALFNDRFCEYLGQQPPGGLSIASA